MSGLSDEVAALLDEWLGPGWTARPLAGDASVRAYYRVSDGRGETFILIPGRTARQGTALTESKLEGEYVEETSTLFMCPDDMTRLSLKNGERVRLNSESGQAEVMCQAAKAGELPPGLLFLPYGDASSRLMGGDTHGTGMPNSKCLDVELEKVE